MAEVLKSLIEARAMDEVEIAAHVQANLREQKRRRRGTLGLCLGLALLAVPVVACATRAVV